MATGVAHRLFRSGFCVCMTEIANPLAVRTTVSFCAAVWNGCATVEAVEARLYPGPENVGSPRDHVAVVVDPAAAVLRAWRPQVLVDGRLLKCAGATSVHQAPLVVGLGPGARCGQDVHCVIETDRGHDLGRIIERGTAAPNTGIPGLIGGYRQQRVLRTGIEGIFHSEISIGDYVEPGQCVGRVEGIANGAAVCSEIRGVVRGLLRDGTHATANMKLGDVDPRADRQACFTISDKCRTISGGVLEAILHRYPVVQ